MSDIAVILLKTAIGGGLGGLAVLALFLIQRKSTSAKEPATKASDLGLSSGAAPASAVEPSPDERPTASAARSPRLNVRRGLTRLALLWAVVTAVGLGLIGLRHLDVASGEILLRDVAHDTAFERARLRECWEARAEGRRERLPCLMAGEYQTAQERYDATARALDDATYERDQSAKWFLLGQAICLSVALFGWAGRGFLR